MTETLKLPVCQACGERPSDGCMQVQPPGSDHYMLVPMCEDCFNTLVGEQSQV